MRRNDQLPFEGEEVVEVLKEMKDLRGLNPKMLKN